MTEFDAPGAGFIGSNSGTLFYANNPSGMNVGDYTDTNGGAHGFSLTPDGHFTVIDVPGAGAGIAQGTFCTAVNPAGEIAGQYVDANLVYHGFVQSADGVITTFDPPASLGAFVAGINPAGAIAGYYLQSGTGAYRGYLRSPQGEFTTFQAPGAGMSAGQGTVVTGINSVAQITGHFADTNGAVHGFLRTPQ